MSWRRPAFSVAGGHEHGIGPGVIGPLVFGLMAGSHKRRQSRVNPATWLESRKGTSRVACGARSRLLLEELTPDSVIDFQRCRKQFEFRHVIQEVAPEDPRVFAELLVRRALAKLLQEPATGRTPFRAEELLEEVLNEVDVAGAPRKGELHKCVSLAMNCLHNYFELEDPSQVSSAMLSMEIGQERRKSQVLKGCIERLDTEASGHGHSVTLTAYVAAPELERAAWLRLGLDAWMLRESGYSCNGIRGRLLPLSYSGRAESRDFSRDHLDDMGRIVEATREGLLRARDSKGFSEQPSPSACGQCAYRSRCSAAIEPGIPALALKKGAWTRGVSPHHVAGKEALQHATSSVGGEASVEMQDNPRASTEGVTVVSTPVEAEPVLDVLMGLEDRYHAIDVETVEWEPGQSVYGHGRVVCFSVYCGDDVDFGSGPRLWVDNMDRDGSFRGVLERFRGYLEDPRLKKVFHNYSFDRAMFHNEGISVAGFAGDTMHMARLEHSDRESYKLEVLGRELLGPAWGKQSLAGVMGGAKVRSVEDLHRSVSPETRAAWVEYSTFDTVATWKLHERLLQLLEQRPWRTAHGKDCGVLLDFYKQYWCPFGDLLVAMEERGVPLDVQHLEEQRLRAERDIMVEADAFRSWLRTEYAKRYPGNEDLIGGISKFNPASYQQLRHLLFGKGPETISGVLIGGLGLGKELVKRYTPTGGIALGLDELTELCGPDPVNGKCGSAEPHLGQAGCVGLSHRCRMASIKKALSSFLESLPSTADSAGRVHASFNLHTSTGRLSCREPNLQQLPALEKDQYQVRAAIKCHQSRRFIVADYGQLDLRVLAHISQCKQMIKSLRSNIDFHSQTALHMYAHVRKAVDQGEVALVRPTDEQCMLPLVKEQFPNERRHAKAVNFGIAYGLSAAGLAMQLDCGKVEAERMIQKWYCAYPEVKRWQEEVVEGAKAHKEPYVVTLRGRQRRIGDLHLYSSPSVGRTGVKDMLSDAQWTKRRLGSAAYRQAINAPVQGGSADVVVEAMLKAHASPELRDLGFSMVLQVHDELVFEGPGETAGKALAVVKQIMEHPFMDGSELAVPLPVDAQITRTWGDAKGVLPGVNADSEQKKPKDTVALDE